MIILYNYGSSIKMDTAHHTSFDNISGQMMFRVNKVGKLHPNFSHHMNRDLFLVKHWAWLFKAGLT